VTGADTLRVEALERRIAAGNARDFETCRRD
jgi:hypothetical protein